MQIRQYLRSGAFYKEYGFSLSIPVLLHFFYLLVLDELQTTLIVRDFFIVWFECFLLSFMVIRLYWKTNDTIKKGAWLFLCLFLIAIIDFFSVLFFERLFGLPEYYQSVNWDLIQNRILIMIPWYVIVIGLSIIYCRLITYRLSYQFQRHEIMSLEKMARKDKLQFLNSQINSHFLFNAMNTISMQVRRKENSSAIDMIADLSDLLRSVLSFKDKDKHVLKEEIELLKKYISIEQERHSEHVELKYDLDLALNDVLVPGFILQPFVENAFKHGLKNQSKMILKIKSECIDEKVILIITNTHDKTIDTSSIIESEGIGIKNTIDRLQGLYGANSQISIENKGNEVSFKIILPLERKENNNQNRLES